MSENSLLNFVESLSFEIYDWVIVFGLVFLTLEIIHDLIDHKMDKKSWRETFNSIMTQFPLYIMQTLFFGSIVAFFFIVSEYIIPWKMPINWWTLGLTIFLADLIYYIEHRLAHRIRLLWVAHAVHHSAQIMNTSTAFRFSMFDPFISAVLHFPLILMGFPPAFIIAGELMVQAYQFWIHNTIIPPLGPIEYIFNTPSAHRVHHAQQIEIRDSNYGGILIIWDRLFGTYQSEPKHLEYGLPDQVDTMNPIKLQLHEFPRLMADLKKAKNFKEKMGVLFGPPAWLERREKTFADKNYANKQK